MFHAVLKEKWCVHWEVCLPQTYFDNIWQKLGPVVGSGSRKEYYYYAAVTFDHENVQKYAGGIHDWLLRHWNWFNVTINSFTALALSLVVARPLGISLEWRWLLPTILMMLVFLFNAAFAYWETMKMSYFHSNRP